MFKIDDKNIKRLEADLQTFAKRSFPFVTKATVNKSAFVARSIYQANIRSNMVTRNKFTERSIRVETTKTLDVRKQAATVGSTADYMEDQEFGGVRQKKGKEGVPIPTSYSAGQGRGSKPRTRLPRRPNKLRNIALRKRRKGSNRKQRNLIAVKEAAASGRKYIFMDLGRRQGLFKVTGGKRRPRVQMVHDLSSDSVRTPRNPMLKPATDKTQKNIPGIYRSALIFQLKRQGLFKG